MEKASEYQDQQQQQMPTTSKMDLIDERNRASKAEEEILKREINIFSTDQKRTSLPFPPTLSKDQRKRLHTYASAIGLKSKSTGRGENHFATNLSNVQT